MIAASELVMVISFVMAMMTMLISGWIRSGDLKYHETVMHGIDRAPEAFIGLFAGANDGKMLVQVATDD